MWGISSLLPHIQLEYNWWQTEQKQPQSGSEKLPRDQKSCPVYRKDLEAGEMGEMCPFQELACDLFTTLHIQLCYSFQQESSLSILSSKVI